MQPTLIFDIETVPDVDAARRVYDFDGLSDADALKAMQLKRRIDSGTDFPKHFLHKIVAISAVLKTQQGLQIWSLGEVESDEKEILERFFAGIDKFQPVLVSWNGGGFDLPVLHYRALYHGVTAQTYWDMGDFNRDRKWNNYISRYQFAHIDLMDVLAGYQPRAVAKLDEIAVLLGLPGKMGMSGAGVLEQYLAGDIQGIRDYCELDVINTYLVYLQFELMRGHLTPDQHLELVEEMKATLGRGGQDKKHWQEYLTAWAEL